MEKEPWGLAMEDEGWRGEERVGGEVVWSALE